MASFHYNIIKIAQKKKKVFLHLRSGLYQPYLNKTKENKSKSSSLLPLQKIPANKKCHKINSTTLKSYKNSF